MQETAQTFLRLSRHELAWTIAGRHPKGRNWPGFAVRLLEEVDPGGVTVTLNTGHTHSRWRRHWRGENSNHYSRDTTLGEDTSRMHTGHVPASNAARNNLVVAVLRREPGETLPETLTWLTVRRERALEVVLQPT